MIYRLLSKVLMANQQDNFGVSLSLWILLRFSTWQSPLSQSASLGTWKTKERRAGGAGRDAKTLNKWGKKQKRGCKPFRKRWPPTPRTATATSPCLLGPIDPLIRYSQSPLLGRPPPQLAVRDGMWDSAPLSITIPVIFCYNTASHFSDGWVEMIWDGKEEEGWLIPSPSLIPPPLGCLYSCGRSHSVIQSCSDFTNAMKQPRIDALVPTTWKIILFLIDTSPPT